MIKRSYLYTIMAVLIGLLLTVGVYYASELTLRKRPTIIPPGINELRIMVNGSVLQTDTPPVIINSRTMLPVRAVFESIGATVNWSAETRTVSASKEDVFVTIELDKEIAFIDNTPFILDSPATIINNRTLVPVRFAAEAFGMTVLWDEDTKTVVISK